MMKSSTVARFALRRGDLIQNLRRDSHNGHSSGLAASHLQTMCTFPRREDDERERQRLRGLPRHTRNYSTSSAAHYQATQPSDSAAIVLSLGAFSAACFAGASAASAYKQWKEQQPVDPIKEEIKEDDTQQEQSTKQKKQESSAPRENIFSKWFDVGGKYYEGGFEDTMTKREAALILGVRESSSAQRIKEAHRKIMVLNHPDAGGSTYMSGKINEAKELLLKGKDKNAKD